ncbi:hypothetical protein TSUD_296340 [Trifolium subterraneum]|uniref:Calcineurin-like phosphoesterase domain-containing protein n=1 Tax=Trifolium subterraneum TaxID=3900 RepID=A0A2Z6MHD4_TRISU|nr:hypothetical protein TSUD_296340 [Trifolium subterraneum]
MDAINDIQKTCDHIITFSHFVPRQELCPEKRMLFYPKLPKIIGSDFLEDRIRSIHGVQGRRDASSCHVFGHTHFCWDAVVDGISLHARNVIRDYGPPMSAALKYTTIFITKATKFDARHCPSGSHFHIINLLAT